MGQARVGLVAPARLEPSSSLPPGASHSRAQGCVAAVGVAEAPRGWARPGLGSLLRELPNAGGSSSLQSLQAWLIRQSPTWPPLWLLWLCPWSWATYSKKKITVEKEERKEKKNIKSYTRLKLGVQIFDLIKSKNWPKKNPREPYN